MKKLRVGWEFGSFVGTAEKGPKSKPYRVDGNDLDAAFISLAEQLFEEHVIVREERLALVLKHGSKAAWLRIKIQEDNKIAKIWADVYESFITGKMAQEITEDINSRALTGISRRE